VYVGSQEEIIKVIELGQTLRTTSATRMNEESSRSHALFMLTVTQKNTETLHIRRGKLVLVRLLLILCRVGRRLLACCVLWCARNNRK
jgi:kinesin family member 5